MSKTITVGISDLNIAKAPDILVTYALGSCVGICLYDPMVKLAGLSHIMLPSSNLNNLSLIHIFLSLVMLLTFAAPLSSFLDNYMNYMLECIQKVLWTFTG